MGGGKATTNRMNMPKKGEHLTQEQKEAMFLGRKAAKTDGAVPQLTAEDIQRIVAENVALALSKLNTPQQGASVEEIAKAINRAVDGKTDELGFVREEYVPEDDLLEIPVTYFAPTQNWNLWCKQVGNRLVRVPYGLKFIPFRMLRAWRDVSAMNGKQQKFISIYVCHGKQMKEFLESTPEFNRVFFRDASDAIDNAENIEKYQRFSRHFGALDASTHGDLVRMASQWGVPTGVKYSRDDYRNMIAEAMTRKEIRDEDSRKARLIRENSDVLIQPMHAQAH